MKKSGIIKKFAALFMGTALILSLSACGGNGASSGGTSGGGQKETVSESAGNETETELSVAEALMGDELDTEEDVLYPDEEYEEDELELDEEETFSGEGDDIEFSVFSSEKMGFSFLYEPGHTAFITETGAAQLAINGDESMTGLSVSVQAISGEPEVSRLIEEKKAALEEEYQADLAGKPEDDVLDMEEHDLTGFEYSYNNKDGETVECTYFIEVADGNYIFYETAALNENREITLDALAIALESLVFEPGYYGDSDAVSGNIENE